MVQKIEIDSDHAEQNCMNVGMRKGRGTVVNINKATIKYEQAKDSRVWPGDGGKVNSGNNASRKAENKGSRKQGEYTSSR